MNGDGMNASQPTGNLLLDSLPPQERAGLLTDAERRPITVGQVRRSPGDAIDTVLFPIGGTYSIIVDADHEQVEAATVGREGVVDVNAALGSAVATQTVLAQVAGNSIDVGVETFRAMAGADTRLRHLIYGYVEAVFAVMSRATACMALHQVNERCARWLLETHDRVDSDTFELKQEFLGRMLAVSRPTVSIAERTLQAAGTIQYRRGKITIVDREALEEASCSCYEANRGDYSRLVPLG
jgi:CRP-like cAMP-binding protein